MKPPQWIGTALIFSGLIGAGLLLSPWLALAVALMWVLILLPDDDYVDRFEPRRDVEKEAEITASAAIGDSPKNLPSRHLTRTPGEVARAAAHTGCDVVTTGTGAPEGRSDKHGRPSITT